MASRTKIDFLRVKNLPTNRPLDNGHFYVVEKPNKEFLLYNVTPDGEPNLIRGITDDQLNRLEQLTQPLLNKISEDYSKSQIDDIVQGLIEDIDNIVVGSSAGLVKVSGTTLPTPETDNNFSIVGEGTYTRAGQSDVVVPSGHMGILNWDGSVWALGSSVEMPEQVADGVVVKGDVKAISGDTSIRQLTPRNEVITSEKNLFDKNALVYNKWINRDLERVTDSTFSSRSVSDFIPVKEGEQYTFTNWAGVVANRRLVILDEMDYNATTQIYFEVQSTITSPIDGYLVMYIPETSNKDIIQVEVGSSSTEYEPFKKVIRKELIEPYILADGKIVEGDDRAVSGGTVYPMSVNLRDISHSKNVFNKENIIEGVQQSALSGTVEVITQQGGAVAYAKLRKNTDYAISNFPIGSFGRRVGLYKDITNFNHDALNEVTSNVFNSGDNEYLVLGVQWAGDAMTDISLTQVEEGNIQTEYSPYGVYTLKGVVAPRVKNVLLTGASFAFSGNPWFDIAIGELNIKGHNRAVSGDNITNTAEQMYDGSLYSGLDFDEIDALIIMHTHNNDVANEDGIKEDYMDYEPVVSNVIPRNQAWDYVLKKYRADCYNAKFDQNSKWFNSPYGKPCDIFVFTDWHDAREVYNNSIRVLQERFGFHLIELDKNIGFSKNELHPVTGEQVSIIYSVDTQVIGGVTYGWHPIRDYSNPIQQSIAKIFANYLLSV